MKALLCCVVIIASIAAPNHGRNRDDDYYEKYYLKKIPKIRVSPDKIKQFIANHLSWFPVEDLKRREATARRDDRNVPTQSWTLPPDLMNFPNTHKPGIIESVKMAANASVDHLVNLKENLTHIKTDTVKMVKPVCDKLGRCDMKGKIVNMTHPLRPRVNCHHTTQLKYLKTTTTTTPEPWSMYPPRCSTRFTCPAFPGTLRPMTKRRRRRRERTTRRPSSRRRRLRVYIDLPGDDGTGAKKTERQTKVLGKRRQPNNSSRVLDTAEDVGTDLAGRVTNLWKCATGSRRTPHLSDVNYYLYTRRNVIQPEILYVNYDLIRNKTESSGKARETPECVQIDPNDIDDFQRISDENRAIIRSNFLSLRAPTKILIHGYTGSHRDTRMSKIRNAYLALGRFNVIQVDWEVLAAPPCYIRVTHHSKFVGKTVAQFIDGLALVGLNMSLLHLVGFSLGAQVSGIAGNLVTVARICRITGLDPALPLFLHTDSSGHLDKSDAEFVDVIHTCGGILAMLDPVGHVDFYPNGGCRQPGCELSNLKCSHSRAPDYYAESVSSTKRFTAQLCTSWEAYLSGECNSSSPVSYMGDPCSIRSEHGKYYLTTKSREPFCDAATTTGVPSVRG